MGTFRVVGLGALVALAALALWAPAAEAHERRQVGSYVVVVGFLHEPAYLEEQNAALITVFRTTDGKAVEGVDKTLKVEVGAGSATRTFDLRAEPGKAGSYIADFIPTKTGVYVFRFFGKIENQDVNERFESGPNRFDEVVTKEAIQFPVKAPSNVELAARVPGEAAAGANGNGALQSAIDRAEQRATLALVLGGLGLLAGVAGVGFGLLRRAPATAAVARGPRAKGDGEPV